MSKSLGNVIDPVKVVDGIKGGVSILNIQYKV